ncbi:hypothetical protein J7L48_00980 [bacterium]|nr:hypothetical protein [bacterium]
MRNRRNKFWLELYDRIYDFDEEGFGLIVKKILSNPKSHIEWEEIIFKAGDTYLTIFKDKQKAKEFYELYIKEFGENGKFSKQISQRISSI